MKKILLFIAFVTSSFIYAQDQNSSADQPIFETKDIDVQPDFPGGLENFYHFFDKTFKKPQVPNLIGKIFLSFVVETDGSLTDIRTLKDLGFGTGIEAEKVLQQSPKWIPGRKNGQRVRVNYILPIGIHTE